MEKRHKRRSSLSEALTAADGEVASIADQARADPHEGVPADQSAALLELNLSKEARVPQSESDPQEEREDALRQSGTEAIEIRGRPAEVSPFTPDDVPSYTLCADAPRQSTSSTLSPLSTVPEDGPPRADELASSGSAALGDVDLISPGSLKLSRVRTPRKTAAEGEREAECAQDAPRDQGDAQTRAEQALRSSRSSDEGVYSIDFTRQRSEVLDSGFNPFADAQGLDEMPPPLQAVMSASDEDFFDPGPEPVQPPQLQPELPFIAHLDFGERNGSGVVGPKLSGGDVARTADKFEVREGEDAEIKQLLWVVENLQEELHLSARGLEKAEAGIRGKRALVDQLRVECSGAQREEAEVEEQLRVLHSRLEAQLLIKLDQEDDLRVSGDKLKVVKAEIVALDESLARAEELRRSLERQAVTRRETQQREDPEGEARREATANTPPSPRSDYSSAWETSESEEEVLDLGAFEAPRHSASVSEDNQAKLKEKGALGGSWLRSVLGGRSRGELDGAARQPAGGGQAPIGGGQSHLDQPTATAELLSDSVDAVQLHQAVPPPPP